MPRLAFCSWNRARFIGSGLQVLTLGPLVGALEPAVAAGGILAQREGGGSQYGSLGKIEVY